MTFIILFWLLCGLITYKLAARRNRRRGVALVMGILFGLFAVIVYFFLPTVEKEEDSNEQVKSFRLKRADSRTGPTNYESDEIVGWYNKQDDSFFCKECFKGTEELNKNNYGPIKGEDLRTADYVCDKCGKVFKK